MAHWSSMFLKHLEDILRRNMPMHFRMCITLMKKHFDLLAIYKSIL